MISMNPVEVKRIQSLDVAMFEESAKDLLRNNADWSHTVSGLVLVVAHDRTVWLCDMPEDEIHLNKAKMLKRIM